MLFCVWHCLALVFRKIGVEEKINLQQDGNKAKAYQVRQVRSVILKHKFEIEEE